MNEYVMFLQFSIPRFLGWRWRLGGLGAPGRPDEPSLDWRLNLSFLSQAKFASTHSLRRTGHLPK